MGQLNFETQEVNDLLQKVKDMPETVKDGKTPVFETGETSTLEPGSKATLEVVRNGDDESGNPKYKINAGIPRGADGEPGSGGGGTADSVQWSKVLNKPTWVDSDTKPKYTASEVGALPASTKFKTINGQSILGEGDIEISGSGGSGQPLTKESIEKVFTGNIESHTHNSTYEYTEFETDVWDGSTISESLQGTGTKDDPYLIQSCADLLYVRANITTYKGSDSLIQFKLTKSLDFGNKAIPVLGEPSAIGSALEFDGNNAAISNFITDANVGLFGEAYPCFFHNFILKDITLNCTTASGGAGFFCGDKDMYNIITNNVIIGKIIIEGELAEDTTIQSFIMAGAMAMSSAPSLAPIVDGYLEANGYYGAFEIQIEDNTIKNSHKLMVLNTLVPPYLSVTKELTGYDFSTTNVTSADDMVGTFEGDLLIATALAYMSAPSNFYRNNEKSQGYICMDLESNISFVTSPSKTTEEMLSDSFVEELNSKFSSPVFVKDKNGGTPVLAPKNATIKYDGYVRQSVFDKLKEEVRNNAGQGGSTTADYSPYMLPKELFTLIDKSPNSSTSEQISAAIGGLDGLQAILKAAKDNRRIIFKGAIVNGISEDSFVELTSCLFTENDTNIGFISTMVIQAGIAWVNYAFGISYEKSTKEFTLLVFVNNINPN